MKKRFWSILVAIALLTISVGACAEQVPSPIMPTSVTAEVAASSSVAMEEDFAIQLVAETETAAAVLTEVQEFVETEAISKFFDEESMAAAVEYLPEGYDVENLMLAEIYALMVQNYVVEYGDVSATFEFAVNYPDDAILLGMIGIVNREAGQEDAPEIAWFPVQAEVNEGCVQVMVAQELLEQITDSEAAIFVLLQDQK